jgi:hypothetical protein
VVARPSTHNLCSFAENQDPSLFQPHTTPR